MRLSLKDEYAIHAKTNTLKKTNSSEQTIRLVYQTMRFRHRDRSSTPNVIIPQCHCRQLYSVRQSVDY